MEIAYFKKSSPSEKLYLGDGSWVSFQDVGNNLGVLIVGKPYFLGQIRDIIRRQVGGVSEITAHEFQDLQKKKTITSPQNSRELVSVQQVRDGSRRYHDAERADGDSGGGVGIAGRFKGTIQAIEHKPVAPGFKPNSTKR